jgi:type II secretory pathway component GspD/PulD (secretin)
MNFLLRLMTACIAIAVILTGASASTQQTETALPQIDATKLEKRLSEIERQLAAVLNEVQQLRRELQVVSVAPSVTVFRLKELDATSAAKLLSDIFSNARLPDFRGNKQGPLIIHADSATNSVIVVGSKENAESVKQILDKLDGRTK